MRLIEPVKLFAVAALVAGLVFAAADAPKKGSKGTAKKSESGKTAEKKVSGDKEKGTEIFKTNCAVCHYADKTDKRIGPGLQGLFKHEKLENGKAVNNANVREVIMEGSGRMMGFKEKLEKQQLDDLMAYLHTL